MHRMRILIADDHELVRKGIRTLVESRSEWEVCGEASNATDTTRKTARLKPDVVLLDITLPDRSGLEAISEILKAHPITKILVLTMHDSGRVASRALAAGASGVVLKSDAAHDLILALEAVGRKKHFLSPAVTKMLSQELHKPSETVPPPQLLTPRETQVLKLLAGGKSSKQIAGALGISPRTVDAHRSSLMRKLNLSTLSDLIHFAIRNRLVEV